MLQSTPLPTSLVRTGYNDSEIMRPTLDSCSVAVCFFIHSITSCECPACYVTLAETLPRSCHLPRENFIIVALEEATWARRTIQRRKLRRRHFIHIRRTRHLNTEPTSLR